MSSIKFWPIFLCLTLLSFAYIVKFTDETSSGPFD